MEIKGEYEVSILIQNMFHSYVFIEKNHNIVTNEGLNLMLEILGGKTSKRLSNVHVGKNDAEPSSLDNYDTLISPVALPFNDDTISVDGNVLTYTIECNGADIYNTCEIGICSDGNNKTLITRDVHDSYDVPSSAIITIRYSLVLNNKGEEVENIEEPVEEEETNDQLSTDI